MVRNSRSGAQAAGAPRAEGTRGPERAATAALALPNGRRLVLSGRPRIMGVVNITPDSFSDGGLFLDPEAAVERALELAEQGADLLDLGAESTRPGGGVYGGGAIEVPAPEEIDRLGPVLEGVRRATELPISVDTRKGEVAEYALSAGADLINDVSALGDPRLAGAVAAAGCPVILMHSRGELTSMQRDIQYDDLLGEVRDEQAAALERAVATGIRREQVVLDPGIGFGKTWRHNLTLLRHIDVLRSLGRPVLVGASRKSFIGRVTGAGPQARLPGSLAAAAWAAAGGADILRVHDVAETRQFLEVWQAIRNGSGA